MSDEVSESKKMNLLEIVAGNKISIPFVYLNPENDQGVDVSGFTEIILTVRDKRGRRLIEKKLTTNGIIWDTDYNGDGTDGRGLVVFVERDTKNLVGIYAYDLYFYDGTNKTRPVKSFMNIMEAVTK